MPLTHATWGTPAVHKGSSRRSSQGAEKQLSVPCLMAGRAVRPGHQREPFPCVRAAWSLTKFPSPILIMNFNQDTLNILSLSRLSMAPVPITVSSHSITLQVGASPSPPPAPADPHSHPQANSADPTYIVHPLPSSNNTGKLKALVEVFDYLLYHQPDDSLTQLVVHTDSQHALSYCWAMLSPLAQKYYLRYAANTQPLYLKSPCVLVFRAMSSQTSLPKSCLIFF